MRDAHKQPDHEVELLKIEMIMRRLDSMQLAERAKIHLRVVQNLLSGQNKTWPPRAAINIALGKRIFEKPRRAHSRPHPRVSKPAPEITHPPAPPVPENRMASGIVTR